MKNYKNLFYIFLIFLFCAGTLLAFSFYKSQAEKKSLNQGKVFVSAQVPAADPKDFPEPSSSFDQLKSYFQGLAQKKGARYAYEVLKAAPLGPNIDLHLLGHVVGDELYKQEGLNGITDCNN